MRVMKLVSASFGAPHVVGIISLAVLALAVFALYFRRLTGPWRWIYVASSVLALYLNSFVGVVQAFQKLPIFRQLAPTGAEPPFVIAQALVMATFIALGIVAALLLPETLPARVKGLWGGASDPG